jgi:dihydrodipicolinate synthase/N-acetylneuraminate lyase
MIDLKARLSGIVTVLNTPFTDNDAVDLDALATNVERALNAGVAGFLVPAMASEVGVLTDEERQEILKTVVATVSGTVPVVGGASAEASSERRRWIDRVMDAGSDAALVAIPYRDTETWERDLRDVAQTGAPLVIQDWDAGGYGAPVETIARLFNELPTFQSIKIEPVLAFSNQHLDISICFFKRLLQRQGIYSTTHCRAPAHRFDAFHERIADELIDHVIATIGDLNR